MICFLSMDDLGDYVSDDDLAIAPLRVLGRKVETLSWRQTKLSWSEFELVVIRTPWDYQTSPDEFLAVLANIDAETRLENPLDVVRWNLNKKYLKEMSERGCPIVPTLWDRQYRESEFAGWLDELNTSEIIIKPSISATAADTYRLSNFAPELVPIFEVRDFLIQPFVESIVSNGEISLFYFNGEFSHAINKMPKAADFRVQEEHGGLITPVEPHDELLAAADKALELIGRNLLYARVDLVRGPAGEYLLMELELIEPSLYLRMDAAAPERFARAIDERLEENGVEQFWARFCETSGVASDEPYQVWYFGNSDEMARELADLVLSGVKTATASLDAVNRLMPQNAPVPHGYSVVTDFDNRPLCVIRTTEIRRLPFVEVDAEFAADEGEGDQSLAYWREVHSVYFKREAAELGLEFNNESLVCCERLELLYRG